MTILLPWQLVWSIEQYECPMVTGFQNTESAFYVSEKNVCLSHDIN